MLAAVVVSLLVNDTPADVASLGLLGCWTLVRWESVDSRAVRRGAMIAGCVLVVLALAGCGSQGVSSPTAKEVVGTVKKESPGKAIFVAQGCNACHTFKAAAATGTVGPDLDKLDAYAKTAKKPLADFVHESIVDPEAYIEKSFQKGVMPADYGTKLSDRQLTDLVDFLTKPQG